MLCLSSLAWLWIPLPYFSFPLDKTPPPFPHSHWAVKSWNTVIWNHCLHDSKKRRTCTWFWSKRIIYKIDAAKNLREFFFHPNHRIMRNNRQRNRFLNILFLLTAWLRLVLYNVYQFFLPWYSAPPQKDVTYEHIIPIKMGRMRDIRITALIDVSNNTWRMKREL